MHTEFVGGLSCWDSRPCHKDLTDSTVQYRALNANVPLNHTEIGPLQRPTRGHYMYRAVVTTCTASLTLTNSTFCPHGVFMCFVWIWEQTAIISLYSINWLVGFYNWDGVCLLRGTLYILRSAHTMYLCVLCGSENKQRLFHCTALTDWLVFITETECVYCAVRSTFYVLPTQCIYVFCVDLRTNSDYFTVQHWLTGWFL